MAYEDAAARLNAAINEIKEIANKYELDEAERKYMAVAVGIDFGLISPASGLGIGFALFSNESIQI